MITDEVIADEVLSAPQPAPTEAHATVAPEATEVQEATETRDASEAQGSTEAPVEADAPQNLSLTNLSLRAIVGALLLFLGAWALLRS